MKTQYMKTTRFLFILTLAALFLMTSCVKDNLNTGSKLNGYWYLSSYQRILKSSSGSVLQSFDMQFTESDSPRYMNVTGARFAPYYEHHWSGWAPLNFTPGYLFTYSPNAEADNNHFTTDISDSVIRLNGQTTFSASFDYDSDGLITSHDAVSPDGFGSLLVGLDGMRDEQYNPSIWVNSNDMPLSATFVLVYTKTDKSHFDSWYKGNY